MNTTDCETYVASPHPGWSKRWLDIGICLPALILALPILLLLALAIYCESPGNILFWQWRVGREGHLFRIWKLRTMHPNAETEGMPVLSKPDDARVTRLGYWLRLSRLDEWPQLWNILRGEMSLVGPRPERPYFAGRYAAAIPGYTRRHAVRPGLTGWAQVEIGYCADLESTRVKTMCDLAYLEKQSLGLDLRILFLWTPRMLLQQFGKQRSLHRAAHLASRFRRRPVTAMPDLSSTR